MSEVSAIRIGLLVAGAIIMFLIWWFGRKPQAQSSRRTAAERPVRKEPLQGDAASGTAPEAVAAEAAAGEAEAGVHQAELGFERVPASKTATLGQRNQEDYDKIVTLYVAARAGNLLRGSDILVAAEKVGLTHGYMNIFHRLQDNRPDADPIFSVANIMKPGSFDLAAIHQVETPAIAFFLTLPTSVSALEAWDTMQPSAQRMAELLDGVLLDEDRNALGRQRITHIRDELRHYDRKREGELLKW